VAKKSWFEQWNYDPDIPYAQDFDQNLRSHYTSVFANISEPLYVYRRVGVTSSWLSQTKAVYYKFVSLVRYGFKKDNLGMSLLSMLSLALRPLFVYLTSIYVIHIKKSAGSNTADRQRNMGKDDMRIAQAMETIGRINIPIGNGIA
jgi:hypothetical protein